MARRAWRLFAAVGLSLGFITASNSMEAAVAFLGLTLLVVSA